MEHLCKRLHENILFRDGEQILFETQFCTKNGERASYSAEYFEGSFEGWFKDKGGEN